MPDISIQPAGAPQGPVQRNPALWEKSKALEASFLSEMLRDTGFGKSRESLGGGVGEDQFSGMMASEQARAMVEAGGIGLAESIYRSLAARGNSQ
ncbi:MAG: rod-binding protein [Boseongicola sp.]